MNLHFITQAPNGVYNGDFLFPCLFHSNHPVVTISPFYTHQWVLCMCLSQCTHVANTPHVVMFLTILTMVHICSLYLISPPPPHLSSSFLHLPHHIRHNQHIPQLHNTHPYSKTLPFVCCTLVAFNKQHKVSFASFGSSPSLLPY